MDSPILADDGHAVAQEILVADTFMNQGVLLARDAGRSIKLSTGDGSRYGADAREALAAGVDLVARTVGPTFGPRGRVVVLDTAPSVAN